MTTANVSRPGTATPGVDRSIAAPKRHRDRVDASIRLASLPVPRGVAEYGSEQLRPEAGTATRERGRGMPYVKVGIENSTQPDELTAALLGFLGR